MLSRVLPSAVHTEKMGVPVAIMTCSFAAIYFLSADFVVKRNMFFLLSSKRLTRHSASAVFALCTFLVFWKLSEATKILTDYLNLIPHKLHPHFSL